VINIDVGLDQRSCCTPDPVSIPYWDKWHTHAQTILQIRRI